MTDHARSMNELAQAFHENSRDKGFWETDGDGETVLNSRNVGEMMMLIVSEVSEAFEDYRNGVALDDTWQERDKPCGIPYELADVLIRTMELMHAAGINVQAAVERKHEYNKTRPYRHGGKRA